MWKTSDKKRDSNPILNCESSTPATGFSVILAVYKYEIRSVIVTTK